MRSRAPEWRAPLQPLARSGRRRALAMHDQLTVAVAFLPGEVVMVLEVELHLSPKVGGDVPMNQRMIGGGVPAHQFHRGPVFPALG